MSEFKIEEGIPLPTENIGYPKYPFRDLGIGDSFFIAASGEISEQERIGRNVRSSGNQCGAKHGLKFTVRKVNGGFRCWRIEK